MSVEGEEPMELSLEDELWLALNKHNSAAWSYLRTQTELVDVVTMVGTEHELVKELPLKKLLAASENLQVWLRAVSPGRGPV